MMVQENYGPDLGMDPDMDPDMLPGLALNTDMALDQDSDLDIDMYIHPDLDLDTDQDQDQDADLDQDLVQDLDLDQDLDIIIVCCGNTTISLRYFCVVGRVCLNSHASMMLPLPTATTPWGNGSTSENSPVLRAVWNRPVSATQDAQDRRISWSVTSTKRPTCAMVTVRIKYAFPISQKIGGLLVLTGCAPLDELNKGPYVRTISRTTLMGRLSMLLFSVVIFRSPIKKPSKTGALLWC